MSGPTKFTPTGIAFYASFMIAFLVGAAVQTCAPESALGAFLKGVAVSIAAGMIVFVAADVILRARGVPTTLEYERDDHHTSPLGNAIAKWLGIALLLLVALTLALVFGR
jgi:hypothetical protein